MKKITLRCTRLACDSWWKGVAGMACLLLVWSTSNLTAVEADDAVPDVRISIVADNEPLGTVLEKISTKTGYHFVLDEQWRDDPVKIALQDTPFEKGLERILARFIHATVYEADKTIRIMIYDENPDAGSAGPAPSRAYRPDRTSSRFNQHSGQYSRPSYQPPSSPPRSEEMLRPEDIPNMEPAEAQAAFQRLWEAGQKAEMQSMEEE